MGAETHMTAAPRFSKAFALIAELAIARGAAPLSKHVGCWETDIAPNWRIALNGHGTPTKSALGVNVPPFTACIERDGWPVGVIGPYDGAIVGGIRVEDELIAALEGALQGGSDGH